MLPNMRTSAPLASHGSDRNGHSRVYWRHEQFRHACYFRSGPFQVSPDEWHIIATYHPSGQRACYRPSQCGRCQGMACWQGVPSVAWGERLRQVKHLRPCPPMRNASRSVARCLRVAHLFASSKPPGRSWMRSPLTLLLMTQTGAGGIALCALTGSENLRKLVTARLRGLVRADEYLTNASAILSRS